MGAYEAAGEIDKTSLNKLDVTSAAYLAVTLYFTSTDGLPDMELD